MNSETNETAEPTWPAKEATSMFCKTLVSRALLCAVAWLPGAALAADGQTLINQSKALAGNVTAGDAPGFPVTISRSGSFRLSSNLVIPAFSDGIVIAADHVTLDLNGFQIAGAGLGNSGNCIRGARPLRGIAVRNGSLTFCFNGIDLSVSTGIEIQQIRAFKNGGGLAVGSRSIVSGNVAFENGRNGISVGVDSTVSGNTASNNLEEGIVVRCPSNVVGNSATGNAGAPILEVGAGCNLANNNPTP